MKKLILVSAVALLPFFASAAVLGNTINTSNLFPVSGSTNYVSGSCGSVGGNNSVGFGLMQNGSTIQMTSNLTTDQNGAFSGNITYPSGVLGGQATLVATCKLSGDTLNSQILTFAQPASSTFALPSSSPTVGGLYSVSGACGASNGIGNVVLTLTSNGGTYPLSTFNLTPTGTFSGNVVIPSNINTGSASLTGLCSNSNAISSNFNVGTAAVNAFGMSAGPIPGNTVVISGTCTSISGNQNGTVNFNLLRNGGSENLPATSNLTDVNGSFNASVFFPANVGSDPANLVVTCPNGSTFSNLIMLGAVDPGVSTPVGAVAAGSPPTQTSNYLVAGEVLFLAGMIGLFAVKGLNSNVQK
jgi:hypothetical protein